MPPQNKARLEAGGKFARLELGLVWANSNSVLGGLKSEAENMFSNRMPLLIGEYIVCQLAEGRMKRAAWIVTTRLD